jgi:hypothetical protein
MHRPSDVIRALRCGAIFLSWSQASHTYTHSVENLFLLADALATSFPRPNRAFFASPSLCHYDNSSFVGSQSCLKSQPEIVHCLLPKSQLLRASTRSVIRPMVGRAIVAYPATTSTVLSTSSTTLARRFQIVIWHIVSKYRRKMQQGSHP